MTNTLRASARQFVRIALMAAVVLGAYVGGMVLWGGV